MEACHSANSTFDLRGPRANSLDGKDEKCKRCALGYFESNDFNSIQLNASSKMFQAM